MPDQWIVIPGWERFQHYKDRNPAWVKLYTELNRRDDWRALSVGSRGVLASLWCEYGSANGQIRASDVPGRIGQKVRREHWDSLLAGGFIQLSASKPLAIRYQNASPHALAREETETEEQTQDLKQDQNHRTNTPSYEANGTPTPDDVENLVRQTSEAFLDIPF